MLVKIHRGTHQIGGSCIEVEQGESRIVIDIGMPLHDRNGQDFNMRKYQSCTGPELVELGILPNIPGLYAWDTKSKPIDGLLISHAHIDHYGLYRFVNKNIVCYAGAATKKLIDLTMVFTSYGSNTEKFSFNFIKSGATFCCGNFSITPYLMDHSAFDAYAFLIEAQGKKIIYSGDFRGHGRKAKSFYWFLHNAPRNVDALLLEGTTFGRTIQNNIETEQDIEKQMTNLFLNTAGIALVYTSSQNIDRLVSLYKAACNAKRIFVIDVYTATILDELKRNASIPYPGNNFRNIKVFYPEYLCRNITEKAGYIKKVGDKYRSHEIKIAEITAKASKIVMLIRASMLKEIEQISNLEGGAFIFSMWKGYLKKKSMENMLNWVQQKNLTFHSLHTSGHADIKTLKKVVLELKPQIIIPVHTSHPEYYYALGENVKILADRQFWKL